MTEIGRVITHKTTHQDAGTDEVDCTGLAGRDRFVDRGDPTAVDWNRDSLSANDTWAELDLSSIVPAGATLVLLRVSIYPTGVGKELRFRKNGNANAINFTRVAGLVATELHSQDMFVKTDSNRVVEYFKSADGFNALSVTVGGWWI